MFKDKDTEEELERLEAELLEDDEDTEDTFEETQKNGDDLLEEIIREVKEEEPVDMDATRRVYRDADAIRRAYKDMDATQRVYGDMDATRRVYEDMDATRVIPGSQKIYNTDRVDGDLQEYSDELEDTPNKGSITGLLVTAAVLSAGILVILIWWVIRYWGVL